MPAFLLDGQPLPYGSFSIGEGVEAINYPANVLDLWSDRDLAAIGIARIADPAPEPVRSRVRKSTVISRLEAAGLIGAAMAALMADLAAFARWTAPDLPSVYADDAGVIAWLTAIGANAAEILAAE